MPKEIPEDIKNKIDDFMDSLYFDVQGAPTMGGTSMSQEYIVKIVTRFVMSICTAFWSLSELLEYIRNRRDFRELIKQ